MTLKNICPTNNSVTVEVKLGKLPPLWRESVIFYANLDCIFFGQPEKTRQLVDNVSGFYGYGSRLLPILGLMFQGDRNLLLLRQEPDPIVMHYFSERLGLKLPDIEIIEKTPACGISRINYDARVRQRLRAHPARILDGYVTDPSLEAMADDLDKRLINSHRSCRDANDKILLNRFLRQVGLPVFDGGEATIGQDLDECFIALREMGYLKAAVRSSLGASGFGMAITRLDDEGQSSFPAHLFSEKKVLVQGWIEEGRRSVTRIVSPSVQFFCGDDDKVTLYDITDQLLSKSSIHEGNISPPISLAADNDIQKEILRQAEIVTSWVASTGFRGTGSIDFVVCGTNKKATVYTCEVNARVTGATYPSLLALHFNSGGAWLMRNVSFGPCMTGQEFFALLEKKNILYLPGRPQGILPLNLIEAENREVTKCQLLFLAGDTGRCLEMIENFPKLLPASCVFDRD